MHRPRVDAPLWGHHAGWARASPAGQGPTAAVDGAWEPRRGCPWVQLAFHVDPGSAVGLFQIDLNDNRKRWDTDHIPGNDNEQEVLEAEYWLHHLGFDGLWNFDLWPQRVAGRERRETLDRFADHLLECINGVRYRREVIKRLPPPEEMRALYLDPDETRISRLLREARNARIDFPEARRIP